jgi:hypothetical protein
MEACCRSTLSRIMGNAQHHCGEKKLEDEPRWLVEQEPPVWTAGVDNEKRDFFITISQTVELHFSRLQTIRE